MLNDLVASWAVAKPSLRRGWSPLRPPTGRFYLQERW